MNQSAQLRENPFGIKCLPLFFFVPKVFRWVRSITLPLQPLPVINQVSVIRFIHQGGGDQKICRGAVAGQRDVVDNGHSQQGFNIHIVWLRLKRIPKKDQDINFSLGNCSANLQVAAERPAHKAVYGQIQFVFNQSARGSGAVKMMFFQDIMIVLCPVNQVHFAVIVRYKPDPLFLAHCGCMGSDAGVRFNRFHIVGLVSGLSFNPNNRDNYGKMRSEISKNRITIQQGAGLSWTLTGDVLPYRDLQTLSGPHQSDVF